MKRHARKHRIELSKCDLCGIETKYKSTLRRHMSAVHLHEARYQCNICGKFFTTNGLMVIHQVNHHNVETPFKCDVCNRGFPMEHFLNSHKERNAMFIDLCK